MSTLTRALLASMLVVVTPAAQAPDPLLSDTRLTVHTLLREDIFAGFRNGNMVPAAHQAAAWTRAYDNYSLLWKQQGAGTEKLPVHLKGEVLSGLTQSAQRTGRQEEAAQYLDKMLTVLADTPYEAMAKQWKADPASAATTSLTCKNCHNPGRLSSRLEALKK